MSFGGLLKHTLTIERPTFGADDDYGQPEATYAPLATVRGLPQPKRIREQAAVHQAGATIGDWTIYLLPTDLVESDRILHDATACGLIRDLPTGTFELTGVRDAAGWGHHLEVDAHLVLASPEAEGAGS